MAYLSNTAICAMTLALAPAAHGCERARDVVFSCATTKGKIVEICAGPGTATYSFGRPGSAPELRLVSPKSKIVYEEESGTGESTTRISFSNGQARYTVERHHAFMTLAESGAAGSIIPDEASLEVTVAHRRVAFMQCQSKSLQTHFEALAMQPRTML